MKNEAIKTILEELEKTKQILQSNLDKDHISDIERDIVLSKLRNIYELILLLKFEVPASNNGLTHIEEEKVSEIISLTKETEVTTLINESDKTEPVSEEKTPDKEELKAQTITIVNSKVSDKKEILVEKFQTPNFINEALKQYQNMLDLSQRIQNQPLKNISSAINMNDKFLFIKELFQNNASLYQTTIDILNTSNDFNEAIRYLDEKFSWDFNDPQVQRLLELVRRRYL